MKADVFSVEGKKLREVELPKQFEADVDRGLIKRAVLSIQSAAIQPKGGYPKSGRDNTARYRGKRDLPTEERNINVGKARLPRLKNRRGLLYGRVAGVPQAVGGPSGHPPKVEEITLERINKKEKRAALVSAIAACARNDLVGARHVLGKELKLPVVVEDKFEQIGKTKQVVGVLSAIGIVGDIDSAKGKRRIRAGKGKRRGRKVKQKKSILIVTKEGAQVFRAARNIPGVDICVVRNLNASLLAPGAMPGRLTVWSEGAIKALGQPKEHGKAGAAKQEAHGKKEGKPEHLKGAQVKKHAAHAAGKRGKKGERK